jgi:hypothetical protein
MGRLLYMPSIEDRERVRHMAATGATEDDIAAVIQMPVKRLKKVYRLELEQGEAQGKQQVRDKLYEIVESGKNLTALMFWVKARCGWRDTGSVENKAAQNWPPFIVRVEGHEQKA